MPANMPDSLDISTASSFAFPHTCAETDNPMANEGRAASDTFTTGRIPYSYGIQPYERPLLPGYDTGVVCLVIVAFLFLSANFRHYSTFLKTFAQDLWKVRNRDNAFDDHTLSESRVISSLIIVLCLSQGIILSSISLLSNPRAPIFLSLLVCFLFSAVFYYGMFFTYSLVGYTFTSQANTRQWLKGYRASQCLLGVVIVIPSLFLLFNPGLTEFVSIFALVLYVVARTIFIFKGLRIFYTNIFSCIYFVLYLCALELLPPVIIFRTALAVNALL